MALINCPECSTSVSDKAISCPSCGCPIATQSTNNSDTRNPQNFSLNQQNSQTLILAKSRFVYIVLGLLFGGLGFHNFYSGHNGLGTIKMALILITLVMDLSTGFQTGFSFVALIILALWALVEVIIVDEDVNGNALS